MFSINIPYFSIAIPTYEMKGYGVEFLQFNFNILNKQTFKDFEVVISDHSLNDDIKNLCEQWNDKLDIKYIKCDYGRGGLSPNTNNAMKHCSGEWIKILYQDDFLFNYTALETTKKHIEKSNKIWFASACQHSNDGKTAYRPFYPKWNNNIQYGINTISCPSVITIKNTENKLYFDDSLIWLMDVEYYKRMYDLYGEPEYINEITVVNRTWNESTSSTINNEIKIKEEKILKERYLC